MNPTFAVDTTTSAYLDQGKVNLRQFIRGGGGFVAIHNAFGTEYNWPWYEGLLGNANYYNHGAFQNGTINIVGSADSSTAGLPATIRLQGRVVQPGAVSDQRQVPGDGRRDDAGDAESNQHPGHGNFHPVAWCQYYDGGRAWLTTLGHDTRGVPGRLGLARPGRSSRS